MARVIRFVDAVVEAQAEALAGDPSVFLIGQEVGRYGGVFRATVGLRERFGPDRVRDTPICEQTMVGLAVGAAVLGMRPIVEIMFMDFIAGAMDAIVNHASKLRLMTGGQASVPLVIRTQAGSGTHHGAQHSQMLESWFVHTPGVKVVMPSTPLDVKGLFAEAMRSDDPVIFVEHRLLYQTLGEVPEGIAEPIPFGRAVVRRSGSDVTVVTAGRMVMQALAVADALSEKGVEVEVIDLRTLVPIDMRTVLASVAKTHRLVVAHEAVERGGWGGEVVSQVVEEAYGYLVSPPLRVGSRPVPTPFAEALERQVTASEEQLESRILAAVEL